MRLLILMLLSIVLLSVIVFEAFAQDVINLQPGQSVTINAVAATTPSATPTWRPTPTPTSTATATATPTATATSTPAPPAIGHVQIYDMSQPVSAEAIGNANVDGGLIKIPWAAVEPRRGAFNWGPIDNFIAPITKVGKRFELAFPAGAYVPSWVYDEPVVAPFEFIWDTPWTYPLCSTQRIPIPWDTNFVSKYSTFVDAVASRYADNPALSRVKLGGINYTTDEFMLPHANGESIHGQCNANDDAANWAKVGYSQSLVLETFNLLARKIIDAFPGKPADAMIVKFGFPGDSNPAPGQTAKAIIAACGEIEHCVMQNNGWKPSSIPISGMLAYQQGAPHGDQLPQGIDLALSQHPVPQVLEIDDDDINMPSNQAALAKAHGTPVEGGQER